VASAVVVMEPCHAPLPTPWNFPFHPEAGIHTSILMSESLLGLIVAVIMHPSALVNNTLAIVIIMLPSVVFIYMIVTRPHLLLIDNFFYKKHHDAITVDHKYNIEKIDKQKEIDRILEKIHKKGMNSLTQKEKQTLNDYSKAAK
jgi:hypothetical protein